MTTPNRCQFWDCGETIRRNYFLCYAHYAGYEAGAIDQCPACGKYKDAEYDVCLNCYRQAASAWPSAHSNPGRGGDYPGRRRAAEPRPLPRPNAAQRDNREFAADWESDCFFVYILLLNDGKYYVGQTRELLERLHEHRNNMSQSTRGREPKLQWFITVHTRREAADLEAKLQELNSNAAGRREINREIVDFKRLVAELDYTPHGSTAENTFQERQVPYGGVRPPSSRRSMPRRR